MHGRRLRRQVQLEALLEKTPKDHKDHSQLSQAVEMTTTTVERMTKTLEDSRMYRKIKAIRESIVVVGFSAEALESLVSSDRKLLKEGILLKVR